MSECSICLLPIEEGGGKTTTCGHTFHLNCFSQWIKNCPNSSCPMCRTQQPNENGEMITFWDNISWVMKTYKYGNIEKSWYRNGCLRTEFVLKIDDDNAILRSNIFSEDRTATYSHIYFSPEELRLIRNGGDFVIPSRQVIDYIYNDNLLDNDDIIYNDNLYNGAIIYNDILDIVGNIIPPNIPIVEVQPEEGIEIN